MNQVIDNLKKQTPIDYSLDILGCIPGVNVIVGTAESLNSLAFIIYNVVYVNFILQGKIDKSTHALSNRLSLAEKKVKDCDNLIQQIDESYGQAEKDLESSQNLLRQIDESHEYIKENLESFRNQGDHTITLETNFIPPTKYLLSGILESSAMIDEQLNNSSEQANLLKNDSENLNAKLAELEKLWTLKRICTNNSIYWSKHLVFGLIRASSLYGALAVAVIDLSCWSFKRIYSHHLQTTSTT
jgi:vacuolar-type H+-ATPase subunit I/STV1